MTHPTTGRRYVHYFGEGPQIAPHFEEFRRAYAAATARIPWSIVVRAPREVPWSDPKAVVIDWRDELVPPPRRQAALVSHYSETVGEPSLMWQAQEDAFRRFLARIRRYDLVLAHTPSGARVIEQFHPMVRVAPVGYDPDVLGRPNWDAEKTTDVVFYGNVVGQRDEILRGVRESTLRRFVEFRGYGDERKAALDRSHAVLCVQHATAGSFCTMRLWYAIASSAAMVVYGEVDAWPAIPGRHYVTFLRPSGYAMDIALDRANLPSIARMAHDELSVYTVERCMEEFVVPAVEEAARR